MKKWNATSVWIPLCGLVSFLALLSCQGKALHPTYQFVAPDFASHPIKRILVLPIVLTSVEARERMTEEHGNPEVEKDAVAIVSGLLVRGLKSGAKYLFVVPEEGASLAGRGGVSEEYKSLVAQWKKDLVIDKEKVMKVGASTGVDAFLCPEIFRWRSVKVDPSWSEGYSHSDVGIRLILYGAGNGEVAWKVADENSLKSSFFTKTSAFQTPPDAPEMETVTQMVVDAVLEAMP